MPERQSSVTPPANPARLGGVAMLQGLATLDSADCALLDVVSVIRLGEAEHFTRYPAFASRQFNGLQRPFVNAARWANRLARVGRKARRLPSPCATERTVGDLAR